MASPCSRSREGQITDSQCPSERCLNILLGNTIDIRNSSFHRIVLPIIHRHNFETGKIRLHVLVTVEQIEQRDHLLYPGFDFRPSECEDAASLVALHFYRLT
jgi:hypothetical protein